MAAAAGVGVVVVKAAEGLSIRDDFCARNVAHAVQSHCEVGTYYFARPSEGTGAQGAQAYLAAIHGIEGSRFDVLDLEDSLVPYGAGLAAYCGDWLAHVQAVRGLPVYLYTSWGYALAHGLIGASQLQDFRLWLAAWQVFEPVPFAPFEQIDAWQFTDEGFMPGVGRVDQSLWFLLPM